MSQRPRAYLNYTLAYPVGCYADDGTDLNGVVFYVGKAVHAKRLDAHFTEAEGGCGCQKCQVIRWIWQQGKPAQRRIVLETLDEQEALDNEELLITQTYNTKYLTNIRAVGFSSYRTATVPSQISVFKKPVDEGSRTQDVDIDILNELKHFVAELESKYVKRNL
jgi:hypothetical protein